jgi:hypothetical protein
VLYALEEIYGLRMVEDFPHEPMHFIFLGNCKKVLEEYMVAIARCVPKEMANKPRSLSELPRFKATEFHLFLSYIGPVVLSRILPRELLQHFMQFHVV